MKTLYITAIVGAMTSLATLASSSDNCTFNKKTYDLEQTEIDALYECVKDSLAEGYAKEGDDIGSTYRNWRAGATGPFAPGAHSNRFLNTFVNDIGIETYVTYGYGDDFAMPVGSIIAKESYGLKKDGKPRPGPLFIMTKVEAGVANEFGGWVYSGLRANGKVMKVKQSFCHDCHSAYADQDSLGYPHPDVQIVN